MAQVRHLDAIWDVAVGDAARLVYLWSVAELMDPEEAEMTATVVQLEAYHAGEYPHDVGHDWVVLGFTLEAATAWIGAGIHAPGTASVHRNAGHSPESWALVPAKIAQ